MRVENHTDYLESLLQGREVVADFGGTWMRALRMRAVERANELTVPTLRDEEWRFTDLSPLYKLSFAPAASTGVVEQSQLDALDIPEASTRLVFVDGHYSAELSRVACVDGVSVGNLADLSGANEAIVEPHLAKLATFDKDAFAAVNTAFLRDGAVIHVGRDRLVSTPIHLLFVATRADSANYPRVLVIAESGSQCLVVEDYVATVAGAYLTDAVSEFFVADNASISHVKLQREAQAAFHMATTAVKVSSGGRYATWTVAIGGRISRSNLSITQAGEGTDFSVDGLAVIGGRQLADMHSSIDHAHAYGRSRQVHKTVVGGGAHAVFNGKILVRKGAQQTDSGQQSRNLLISGKARVDTKPQLEIFADDVKCAHGATVGQLEAEELFYLKSRGLSETAARNLLTYAFAAQIIERIPVKSIVEKLEKTILEQTQTKEPA